MYDIRKLLDLHKSKQGNTTNLNISFSNEKRAAQVGFEHTAYEADVLPTELPRQPSWLGQIKVYKGNQSNLTRKIGKLDSPLRTHMHG